MHGFRKWFVSATRQAIIWTNTALLLTGPLGIMFREICIKIQQFSYNKRYLILSAKRQPFYHDLRMANHTALPSRWVQCRFCYHFFGVVFLAKIDSHINGLSGDQKTIHLMKNHLNSVPMRLWVASCLVQPFRGADDGVCIYTCPLIESMP